MGAGRYGVGFFQRWPVFAMEAHYIPNLHSILRDNDAGGPLASTSSLLLHNARSVKNKIACLSRMLQEEKIDLACGIETLGQGT